MAVSQNVLGMNARNFLYIRKHNFRGAKRVADDKLATKKILLEHDINTPKLIAVYSTRKRVRHFRWETMPKEGFVIKPARGYAGGGIIAFETWKEDHGITVSGNQIGINEIETHLLDILDGAYSLQNLPDYAFAEELIRPHAFFKKYQAIGLPDIRIIVLNHIPIMSMIRWPTEESGGKANLNLGALALGIDIRTGITSKAYHKHKKSPRYLPGTKTKVRGLKIPHWDEILNLAVKTQSVSGLGFAGIDIVVDEVKGAMVIEVNARPGLSIQNANDASLRTRLERVENMKHVSPERGVEVAKSLFAEPFSEKVRIKPKIVGVVETVRVEGENEEIELEAKIDSGAFRTSIDHQLAERLEVEKLDKLIKVQSASGRQVRDSAKITFHLAGKKITTTVSITDRSDLEFPMIIGRRDLKGFLVDPMKNSPAEPI